jgi:dihydrodipicolinate synthase/N-acetylneuraminate lyase
VSGIGERPAIIHLRDFGLQGFTSGSVCVAPNSSMRILALCKARRWDEAAEEREHFLPLENLRDAFSPIRVLHDAVTLAGIADMGPMLPMLSNLADAQRAPVRDAALALRQHDGQLAPS